MKPLRSRLLNAAVRTRVSQVVVEKDYALGYLLGGIAVTPELGETLVLKGVRHHFQIIVFPDKCQ